MKYYTRRLLSSQSDSHLEKPMSLLMTLRLQFFAKAEKVHNLGNGLTVVTF